MAVSWADIVGCVLESQGVKDTQNQGITQLSQMCLYNALCLYLYSTIMCKPF